ncbi:MAG TPA: hypothetical protein VFV52_05625 [Bacilli bacterium]|nr:hypothetical protein [Bacilli bacterium]
MWELIVGWTTGATLWDWVWHILALFLVVVFSVPQVFIPLVQKLFIRKKKEDDIDNEEQLSNHP